eukprot:scaffold1004_cov105-Cylindrotheca_fusiformis.AAC.10
MMTSPQPTTTTAIPQSPPEAHHHQPPVAAASLKENNESRSAISPHEHPDPVLVTNDSSKTNKSNSISHSATPEELSCPDLAWSPHRQREISIAAGAPSKTTTTMDTYLASPAVGWPQRSPMKPDHEPDVASFALFTQSFDTLSDAGHFLSHAASGLEHLHPEQPPRKIDLATGNNHSNWVGDISPIKLTLEDDDHNNNSRRHARSAASEYHHSYHSDPRLPSPPPQYPQYPQQHQQHQHYEAYSAYQHAAPPRSNPFYVLRSAYRGFVGCSYLLPCLENPEICPISLTSRSSVQLCHDENAIPSSRDLVIARRRIETAIHAFGGYIKPRQQNLSKRESIFRLKANQKSSWKQCYEESFHRRYAVNVNHISWEVEQNPPVYTEDTSFSTTRRVTRTADLNNNSNGSDGAVNAYTASEPGVFAKPLSEMNNFVSYDSAQNNAAEFTPQPHVTPETKARDIHSSQSSLSTTESVDGGNATSKARPSSHGYPRQASAQVAGARKRTHSQMYQNGYEDPRSKIFVKPLALRPEHFRAVTPIPKDKRDGSEFQYPPVTLTFRERKRLSDTLFFLSKEIPNMTMPVATSLRVAREKNEWDLSVAELLTQIVVGLYCREGDHRLDGLQDYLIRLGISC